MNSNIEKILEVNNAMQSNNVISLNTIIRVINNSKSIAEYYDLGYPLKSWMLAYLIKKQNISVLEYITDSLGKPVWDSQYWQTLTKNLKIQGGSIEIAEDSTPPIPVLNELYMQSNLLRYALINDDNNNNTKYLDIILKLRFDPNSFLINIYHESSKHNLLTYAVVHPLSIAASLNPSRNVPILSKYVDFNQVFNYQRYHTTFNSIPLVSYFCLNDINDIDVLQYLDITEKQWNIKDSLGNNALQLLAHDLSSYYRSSNEMEEDINDLNIKLYHLLLEKKVDPNYRINTWEYKKNLSVKKRLNLPKYFGMSANEIACDKHTNLETGIPTRNYLEEILNTLEEINELITELNKCHTDEECFTFLIELTDNATFNCNYNIEDKNKPKESWGNRDKGLIAQKWNTEQKIELLVNYIDNNPINIPNVHLYHILNVLFHYNNYNTINTYVNKIDYHFSVHDLYNYRKNKSHFIFIARHPRLEYYPEKYPQTFEWLLETVMLDQDMLKEIVKLGTDFTKEYSYQEEEDGLSRINHYIPIFLPIQEDYPDKDTAFNNMLACGIDITESILNSNLIYEEPQQTLGILPYLDYSNPNWRETNDWGFNILHLIALKAISEHTNIYPLYVNIYEYLVKLGFDPDQPALIDDQDKVTLAKIKGTLPKGYGKTAKQILTSSPP